MKTWLIAASAFGGIFALDIIRLSAVILKKNMGIDSMIEYIGREAAIESIMNDAPEQVGYSREDAADCIRYMDAADVAPVRHGKWLPTTKWWQGGSAWKQCSECGILHLGKSNFCPNCGAKMESE